VKRKAFIDRLVWLRDESGTRGIQDFFEYLSEMVDAFDSMPSSAASIMGSKGGNTPPKPGSRPRGRPRKEVKERSYTGLSHSIRRNCGAD
jgi:hypothetical protein